MNPFATLRPFAAERHPTVAPPFKAGSGCRAMSSVAERRLIRPCLPLAARSIVAPRRAPNSPVYRGLKPTATVMVSLRETATHRG